MAGNFDELQIQQRVEKPLLKIADHLSTLNYHVEMQNNIRRKLLEEQNAVIQRAAEEISAK